MNVNFEQSFAYLLASEGGYSNNRNDSGGETNLGVTKAAWASYLGRTIEDGEIAALTPDTVKPFYKSRYWYSSNCHLICTGLDYLVFDFSVNAGTQAAARILQRTLGVNDDGVIGQQTLNAINENQIIELIRKFGDEKTAFYKDLVMRNPKDQEFLIGWINRILKVENNALEMIKKP